MANQYALNSSNNMKILVTGATGFLGSEIVRQLLAKGDTVRILARNPDKSDLLADLKSKIEVVQGDVTDPLSLKDAMQGMEQVFHAAAFVGFGGKSDRTKLHEINVQGTANVVNAALATGIKRVVLTSSMAAFGRPEKAGAMIDESLQWQESKNNSEYAKSKYAAEMEIHRGIAEGLDAVIVNPALIFGVGRKGENTMQIIEQIRSGKLPAVPSGATNVVDVRDVARGHLLAMERGKTGERYFLGGENLEWKQIVHTVATAFGVKAPTRTLPFGLLIVGATVLETLTNLIGMRPLITRETIRTSASRQQYSTAKAEKDLGYSFRPFQETAQNIAASFSK
jgi:dihydroflavonol-4-reductase